MLAMLAMARTRLKAKNEAAGLSTPDRPPGLDFIPASVRSRSRRRVLDAGATLFRSRARPEWLFYVIAGELLLVRHSEQGRMIVLQRVRNGFFAEASVESQAYHCDGVAGGATEVLALPLDAFR